MERKDSLDRSREGVIKAWFDYNPDTGEITWKEWVSPDWYKHAGCYATFMKERAGKPVDFYKHPLGHLHVTIGGKQGIYAHQIVWVLTYGELPKHEIDHIDGDPQNNAVENLRDVPRNINHRNQKLRSSNSSGVTGVSLHKETGKWVTSVTVNGKYKHLGIFRNIEDAVSARQDFLSENKHLGFTERHGKCLKTDNKVGGESNEHNG